MPTAETIVIPARAIDNTAASLHLDIEYMYVLWRIKTDGVNKYN